MAKTPKLDKPTARKALPARHKPYAQKIDEGLFLEYRKGARARKWYARAYAGGKYVSSVIGLADDDSPADGVRVLSWSQAQQEARRLATELHARAKGVRAGNVTVADAMESYLGTLAAPRQTRLRAELHILPKLGERKIRDLTSAELREWLKGVAATPPLTRGGKPMKVQLATAEAKADYQRRRKDNANRILTILKAALNHAASEDDSLRATAWDSRRLKPFPNVAKPRDRFLTKAEIGKLLAVCEGDFHALVLGALHTGMRYGDLAKLQVGDFQPRAGCVMSAGTKQKKPHPVYLTKAGIAFFRSVTKGRDAGELIFMNGTRPWRKGDAQRPMRRALEASGIARPEEVCFHSLRHASVSHLVEAGVSTLSIARNVGHADTRQIERVYGHLQPSFQRQQIEASLPNWK
ncbi:MAG: site-specific integrase [Chromatiales bacterium]|nr:site-specific integrase [Chromatiales bacterium]